MTAKRQTDGLDGKTQARDGKRRRDDKAADPIGLEILRNRLQAIARDGAAAIERTAISPVVTEAKDFAVGLYDADGNVIDYGGLYPYGGPVMEHPIRSTIARYGQDIRPGDVFFANDPHAGGGLHTGDVVVQRPVFVGDRRVAWAGSYAHMIDVGGMHPGVYMPDATECYQEGLRLPPVRLLREGEEVSDVWDIIRNNVRLSNLVEMDIRSLVAGNNAVHEGIAEVATKMGVEEFTTGLQMLCALSERELRRRIAELPDGVYRVLNFIELNGQFCTIPCALTIDEDRMIFDFEGCPPQVSNWMGAKDYLLTTKAGWMVWAALAPDLPFTHGIFAPIEVRAPAGTMANILPPAPVNHAQGGAMMVGMRAIGPALTLALQASEKPARGSVVIDVFGSCAVATACVQTWSWVGPDGQSDVWLVIEGIYFGPGGQLERDGNDLGWSEGLTKEVQASQADMEILESWYPILIQERRPRPGVLGPGKWRAGSGVQMIFGPHGTDRMVGQTMDLIEWLPPRGVGGGFPGVVGRRLVHRGNGDVEEISINAAITIEAGDRFYLQTGAGGGFGDPLQRDPEAVARDVRQGRITAAEALEAYGVVCDQDGADLQATERAREAARRARLERAHPPLRPISIEEIAGMWEDEPSLPLYAGAGIVQRGPVAFVEESGAPLAVAPDHWTDGCPMLEWRNRPEGPEVVVRAYLDPATGRSLLVDVVPGGSPRSFESAPRRWTEAAQVLASPDEITRFSSSSN